MSGPINNLVLTVDASPLVKMLQDFQHEVEKLLQSNKGIIVMSEATGNEDTLPVGTQGTEHVPTPTRMFRVQWEGPKGPTDEMFTTRTLANKFSVELRKNGISSHLTQVDLVKLGKKDAIALAYNGNTEFYTNEVVLKEVSGVKKPADPALAAQLKMKQSANKHRGLLPVFPVTEEPKEKKAPPKAAPKDPSSAASTSQQTAPSAKQASGSSAATTSSSPAASKLLKKKAPEVGKGDLQAGELPSTSS